MVKAFLLGLSVSVKKRELGVGGLEDTGEAWLWAGGAWGVDVSTQAVGDGLCRDELRGADWAQSLAAAQAMTVGFNALSGEGLSGDASLTSELLMAPGTELTLL